MLDTLFVVGGVVGGFLSGLLTGLMTARREHDYALVRDEWNAGIRIRRLLNTLLEAHRYSGKLQKVGPERFFRIANAEHQDGPALVDQADDAVNEFKDFLPAELQTSFEGTWGRIRHEIRRMHEYGDVLEVSSENLESMRVPFIEVGELLSPLKAFTLRLRKQPWYRPAARGTAGLLRELCSRLGLR